MSLLDRSRVEIRLGAYGTAPAAALADPNLLPRVQEYRRLTGSRMVPVARDELSRKLPAGDFLVTRKVDGEFDVLVLDGDEVFTLNPGGTVRVGLPFLDEARARLRRAGVDRALVAGELYVERADGRRGRIHDVSRLAGRPASAEELERLRFAVFDLIEPAPGTTAETRRRIEELFAGGRAIHPVDAAPARRLADVEERYRVWVEEEGSEGIVLRSDVAGLFKVKPRHTIDAVVVGFTEGTDDRRGMIHDLLVALMRPDGGFHLLARVGGGLTDDQRREFLSDLRDLAAESDYTEVNSDHLAYQMVRPEWVVEVSCVDLLAQTTRGGPIEKMVLSWDAAAGRYELVRRLPLAALIGPSFVRRRLDKSVRPDDVRLSQITDLVEVDLADRDASRLVLPPSELLRREAWVKVLRGKKMVRKLLLWKTNKEQHGDEYPAYVLYLTDFSPNRKTSLEREIRVSSSRDQIERLWDELKKEVVVGGWTRADG